MVMSEVFEHLHPAYREYACLADHDRIEWIRADRWINHRRAEAALGKLEDLLTYPKRDRMPCLLLFGDVGMGKTKIIRKFVRDHPAVFNEGTGVTTMPVVAFQMPTQPDEGDFYDELLTALGVPQRRAGTVRGARNLCRRLLGEMNARVLIIDEVHAMLAGTYRQQRIFLNTLRFLTNDLRIPLVCAGTDEARMALLTDQQLADRFDALELTHWRDDQAFRDLLASLAAILPLRQRSSLSSVSVSRRVLSMTDGITVRVFRLIETVAIAAIRSGREMIDEESFTAEDLVLPLVSMTVKAQRGMGRKTSVAV
ncbi:TniB [Azospirillum thiophilum]|uniref:Transposase n=2 Tax=Azospirillum thiophilum TaxID=528244 RepID=A0AAC8W5I9_9PROT|nr:transposase [Azospirillum thiophilum]KJR62222.1 TniB [Azospirillum thiophilum]